MSSLNAVSTCKAAGDDPRRRLQPRQRAQTLARSVGAYRDGHRRDHRHRNLCAHRRGIGDARRPLADAFVRRSRHRQCAAALCYAEVSSKVPISGSAYTYTYATVGEFLAWIIGWSLVLEYALGAATVSVGWSGYFTFILHTLFNLNIPAAWQHSHWDATPGILNLPAAAIIFLITALLVRGTKESGSVNAVIVTIKVAVVLFFIVIGLGHINPANYHLPPGPNAGAGGYFPFGWSGMLGGAAFMFFAYIGFDAVSTTAEEAKNPGRDLPFGIIMSLVICTILYIIVVAILNGMVPFYTLNVAFPVAFAVNSVGLAWAGVVISFGAIAGLTTVLLVMMYGQTRVFYAMSRDGLIPPASPNFIPCGARPCSRRSSSASSSRRPARCSRSAFWVR